MTPSKSYRFVWTDAAINRDTNNLASAAVELFRNGDHAVEIDGEGTVVTQRVLPFEHDGFGQDDVEVTVQGRGQHRELLLHAGRGCRERRRQLEVAAEH